MTRTQPLNASRGWRPANPNPALASQSRARARLSDFDLTQSRGYTYYFCLFTLLVNLLLPKGGYYQDTLPITWGYLLLAVAFLFTGSELLLELVCSGHRLFQICVCLLLAFASYVCIEYVFRSANTENLHTQLYIIVAVLGVPLAAISTTRYVLVRGGSDDLRKIMAWSLLGIFVVGVITFISSNWLGEFVGIPYVTFTGDDVSLLALKHVDRGDIFKMGATYNNGNILGINLLIWAPLVTDYLKGKWKALSLGLWIILFCTLSRTVWVGWIAVEVLTRLQSGRGTLRKLLIIPIVGIIAAVIVWEAGFFFNGRGASNFLMDSDLGGRRDQLDVVLSFFGTTWDGLGREIVYMWMLGCYGMVGTCLFLAAWTFPVFSPPAAPGAVARAAKIGLIAYLIMMASDGAFMLGPTQMTVWLVACFIFFGGQKGPVPDAGDDETSHRFQTPRSQSALAPGG